LGEKEGLIMNAAAPVILDESTHTYYGVDGRAVPGVTRIIDDILQEYRSIDKDVLRRAQIRGTHVHKACELHDLHKLDFTSLSDEISPFLESYMDFLSDTGFVSELIETRLYSDRYKVAGTLDRLGQARGQKRRWLPDIKSCVVIPKKSAGLQTAAYEDMLREMGLIGKKEIIERYALQLRPGMSPPYKLAKLDNPGDLHDFRAIHRAYQLKWR
jgi:hypothetical protein